MITFTSHSDKNMGDAITEYSSVLDRPCRRYVVAHTSLFSSEGNQYLVDADYNREPTTATLKRLATKDYREFYAGTGDTTSKEQRLKELLDSYIVIDTVTRTKE